MLYFRLMKVWKKILPFLVIIGAALLLLYVPDVGPEKYTDLSTYFQTERGRQSYTGFAVVVIRDGGVYYVNAFGADGSGKPLSADTPFCLGAVSESITGLATLCLEKDGRIGLDTPVKDYLPDFGFAPQKQNGDGSTVTLRHLLTHTSGVSGLDFDDYHPEAADLKASVRVLKSAKPRAKPGVEEHYIDTGYQTVGLILEKQSGEDFAGLIERLVFKPLAMEKSSAGADKVAGALPMGASSFFGIALPRRQVLDSAAAPSNYIVSTPRDMGSYLSFLLAPQKTKKRPIPVRFVPALFERLEKNSGYAYGWRVSGSGKELSADHLGPLGSSSAAVSLWPAQASGVAILAPQNSLLQSLIAMPALISGTREIISKGSTSRPFPLGRLYILLAVVAVVHILALALQTGGALSWAKDVKGRAEASDGRGPIVWALVSSWLGIAVRLLIGIFTPLVLSAIFGRRVSWAMAFALEPGIASWALAAISFGMLRNLARLAWLHGPR